jgi:hypothetical protein
MRRIGCTTFRREKLTHRLLLHPLSAVWRLMRDDDPDACAEAMGAFQ